MKPRFSSLHNKSLRHTSYLFTTHNFRQVVKYTTSKRRERKKKKHSLTRTVQFCQPTWKRYKKSKFTNKSWHVTYQFTAVENIDSQSNWKEMNVIKSLDHRFQTPKMKFLKYLWTVDYNRAFFTKKTDRRLKYGRKNRSIRSRTNATVSLPLEIEALMVLQHMLSWKLLCTAPPRSTVALSRFPDRRLADIVLYRCAHMKGRQQCRPEKNRILKKKKTTATRGHQKYIFWTDLFLAGRGMRTMACGRLCNRVKCPSPTTSRLPDCFSTSDSNVSAVPTDMWPHGAGTSLTEESSALDYRVPSRR